MDHKDTTLFEVRIKVSSSSWIVQGKPPLIIEKTLTLPPKE